MSLIKCPECGKEFSDMASACPNCGCPTDKIVRRNIESNLNQNPQINRENQGLNRIQTNTDMIRRKAILTEKQQLIGRNSFGFRLAGIIAVIIGIVSLFLASVIGGLFFIGLGIYVYIRCKNDKQRIKDLEKMERGAKRILICPYCKSTDITVNMVQERTVQGKGKIYVSDNVNPLKPFTHTNIKSAPVVSTNMYGNKYQCQSCGRVFDKVDEIWDR